MANRLAHEVGGGGEEARGRDGKCPLMALSRRVLMNLRAGRDLQSISKLLSKVCF